MNEECKAQLVIVINPAFPDRDYTPARAFRTAIPFAALCPNSSPDHASLDKAFMHFDLALEMIVEKLMLAGCEVEKSNISIDPFRSEEGSVLADATISLDVREAGLAAELVALVIPSIAAPCLITDCKVADDFGNFQKDSGYSTISEKRLDDVALNISISSYDGDQSAVFSLEAFDILKDMATMPGWALENTWTLGKTLTRALLPLAGNRPGLISFLAKPDQIQINLILSEENTPKDFDAALANLSLSYPSLARLVANHTREALIKP